MAKKSLDKLFIELHNSYLKTADYHSSKTARSGHTFGMELQGEWFFAPLDPRESSSPISFAPDWRTDWDALRCPEWLALTRIAPSQSKLINRSRRNLRIDKVLIGSILKESHGLWVLYLRHAYSQQLNQKTRIYEELAYLELLCPNIFSIASKIVSEESFGKIKKTIRTIEELDEKSLENKKYYYLSGIKKLKQKKGNIYSPIFKSKELNWTSKMYPTSFPVSFNLSKMETTILVAHELYRLEILPLLQPIKIRKRKCLTCGRNFDPKKEIDWFGWVPPTICSICLQMAANTNLVAHEHFKTPKIGVRKRAIAGIVEFERIFGFIPASNFDRKLALSSLTKKNKLNSKHIEIIKALAVLPRHETAKKYFGSWAHLLHSAGALEKSKTTNGGFRSIASDQHLCLSIGERLLCESLTRWKIRHSKEPFYPFDAKLNPNRALRADFQVKNTLIEFAGRMTNETYVKQMSRKVELAKKKNIKLIVMTRIDDETLSELKRKLSVLQKSG